MTDVNQPLLFEMMRSFTTLARTLNLSHAVMELNSTRQTVRRHIASLEEAKGEILFDVVNRQYRLTEAGQRALPEALELLARGQSWLRGHASHRDGMRHVYAPLSDGRSFWLQQRRIGEIWTDERPLLRESFRAWAAAGGALEAEPLDHIRPYVMVFRASPNGWICVEIGDESSYVSWSGWASARSSIGRDMTVLPGADEFAHLMIEPFEDAAMHQSTRLDHVYTQLQREVGGPYFPISYARLLMSGRFPDGTLALISVVDRHYDIRIDGVSDELLREMPADAVMPAHPSGLKFEQKLN